MRIRINVFPGVQNIPNFVAEQNGFFAAQGLEVETTFTKSSEEQRAALAGGICEIAHSAVDNALALIDAGVDAAIVLGLDRGFNKLVVRPEIASFEQLRGKRFAVDAPDTAFALLAYEVLRRKGLERERDYTVQKVGATGFRLKALQEGAADFAMLNLPFNLLAQAAGLRLLADPLDVVDSYQAVGGFVLRPWARDNADALSRYIKAYVEGLRWARQPANREAVITLLQKRFDLARALAEACYEQAQDPRRGFNPDAQIDMPGMACVINLRETFSPRPGNNRRKLEDYVDESFWREAVACVGA
jgi:ABC-type nitrate/sulfonate/bicarbonate transport system substrate-binding protein